MELNINVGEFQLMLKNSLATPRAFKVRKLKGFFRRGTWFEVAIFIKVTKKALGVAKEFFNINWNSLTLIYPGIHSSGVTYLGYVVALHCLVITYPK